MKTANFLSLPPLLVALTTQVIGASAEEMATIPKARLQELERKEKELERLTGELTKTRGEKAKLENEKEKLKGEAEQLQKAKQAAETKAAVAIAAGAGAEPVIAHDTPPLVTLPPWKKGDVVDTMDLMNHYRAEAATAAKRYETQRIQVQGEIVGFEKPPFVRPYNIFLRTTERNWKVICRVEPPEKLSAVFTARHGEELVGSTSAGARATLARLGQKAIVEGNCKGMKDQSVTLTGCRLVSVE
jgi:hypothetical protein